ncbi:MAG: hypothetical protein AAF941_10560 [Pseudomonadota bacterium]
MIGSPFPLEPLRVSDHPANGEWVIELAISPHPRAINFRGQVMIVQPCIGSNIQRCAKVRKHFIGFDRTQADPAMIGNEHLGAEGVGLLTADELWAFQMERDVIAAKDFDTGALAIEKWTERLLKRVAILVISKKPINHWNESECDAFWDLDCMRNESRILLRLLSKKHDNSPVGWSGPT